MHFRVALVHHHPLPVVPAETVPPGTMSDKWLDRLEGVLRVLMGEQTNVFKNSGSLLKQSLDYKVDLILHGHQHHSWYSCINYPHQMGGRLLVAGAPSAVMPGHSRTGYSVYRLYATGNVEVFERTTAPTPLEYQNSPGTPFWVMSPSEQRIRRRDKIIEQLRGKIVRKVGTAYGKVRARDLLHSTEIDEDGNAIRRIVFYGLEAIDGECDRIPITRYVPSGYVSCLRRPRVRIIESSYDRYRDVQWIEGGALQNWCWITLQKALVRRLKPQIRLKAP